VRCAFLCSDVTVAFLQVDVENPVVELRADAGAVAPPLRATDVDVGSVDSWPGQIDSASVALLLHAGVIGSDAVRPDFGSIATRS
jgi:hypothetical protein